MRRFPVFLAFVTTFGFGAHARAQDGKRPDLYDEAAQGSEQVAAALAKARAENRRVLIQWGANW